MSSEQQPQEPLPYRALANPRRQRASTGDRRRPVTGPADVRGTGSGSSPAAGTG